MSPDHSQRILRKPKLRFPGKIDHSFEIIFYASRESQKVQGRFLEFHKSEESVLFAIHPQWSYSYHSRIVSHESLVVMTQAEHTNKMID